jgi:Cupin-like domain
MTKIITGFFIFCLVLFVYLHIQFHLKTSNDLEMYEIDQASKDKLEEICDIRQPVLFEFDNSKIVDTTNKTYIVNNYQAFEIKIRNIKDNDSNDELYVPLQLRAAVKLFDEDKNSIYLSEKNGDFLQETGISKSFSYNDSFLRPHMVSNCNYDILLGSNSTTTPFKYEINYRNFFLLTQGSAQIKMAPPKSDKYLYPNYDYENFEFSSPVNPWNVQPNYVADFDKIKCLEFTLMPGKTLFIPAYWWYSIKFGPDTSISCLFYRTYMNNIAISPYVGMHALQIQNVKRNTVKKVDISELNNSNVIITPTEHKEVVDEIIESPAKFGTDL